MIYSIIALIFCIIIFLLYQTPAGRAYEKWYIKKTGYWDTVILVILLIGFNIWFYSMFGYEGLIFPWTIALDIILIITANTSYLRVKKFKSGKFK